MALGLRLKLGLGAGRLGGIVSSIKWLLTNVLDLIATVGPSAVAGGTSVTYIEEWDLSSGLVISNPAVPAGVPCSRGQRKSTDADEGGSVGAPVFLNTVSKVDATKLHPTKQLTENGVTSTVFVLHDYWPGAAQGVSAGSKIYAKGTDGHNYSLSTVAGGTTDSAIPAVDTADIGGTVADNDITWNVDHYYSNLATATKNYLPRVLNEPAAIQQLLNSDSPATQTTGSLATGFYTVSVKEGTGSVDLTAGTATIDGTGSTSLGVPFAFEVTGAGTVTATVVGSVDKFQLEGGSVPTSFILSAGGSVQRNTTSFTVQNPLPVNDFMWRARFVVENQGGDIRLFSGEDDAGVYINSGGSIRFRGDSAGEYAATFTPTNGVVYGVGLRHSVAGGTIISINGADLDAGFAGANHDISWGDTIRIGSRLDGNHPLQGGIPDLTINTDMSDSDWYKDTTWSDPE